MKLGELVKDIDRVKIVGNAETEIGGIQYDTRLLHPGDLYVALEGSNNDGHAFISDACRKSVSCLLIKSGFAGSIPDGQTYLISDSPRQVLPEIAHRFYGNPEQSLDFIGITGTNGKTTTTYMIESMLSQMNVPTGIIGTIGIKFKNSFFESPATTPESPDIARILRQMVEAETHVVAMEVSSHSLSLNRVDRLKFKSAVFTNLTQDHLDFHCTIESYFKAKSHLFDLMVESSSCSESGTAIINLDDPYGKRLLKSLSDSKKVITYGFDRNADLQILNEKLQPSGSSFQLRFGERSIESFLPFPGRHNLMNLAAAMGAVMGLNFPFEPLVDLIPNLPPVAGRMQKIDLGQPFLVIIDYAHTPDALENLLKSVRAITLKRMIIVFGCGGDRDRGKRPVMGQVVSNLADVCIVTSDNPRTEDPHAIIQDIIPGIVSNSEYRVIPNRHDAIQKAIQVAHEGDTIVIAGKGHENYQIIGRTKQPFDDSLEAAAALKDRGYGSGR